MVLIAKNGLFQVWLKVNFWSGSLTEVDNRLCLFPFFVKYFHQSISLQRPKRKYWINILADGVFSMGPFRGEYLGKSKVYAVARQPTQQTMSQQRSQSIFLKSTWKSGQLNIMNFSPNNFVSSLFASFNFLFLWKEV